MARLTLSFKDRKLKAFGLQPGDCVIGRDSDCTIRIDSLAVAPRHARIRALDQAFVLEPLDGAQVLVNDRNISSGHELEEGDRFQIGKHTFYFSAEGLASKHQEASHSGFRGAAWLQIQSGSHLGRTIRLDKAFTRIGRPDGSLAVIAHREDGYYLSHLQGENTPRINGHDIAARTTRLCDNDFITVGELRVQFFARAAAGSDESFFAESPRRRSTRTPLDVPARLWKGQEELTTQLCDISLYGALVRPAEGFEPDPEQVYRLSIPLESGPDIVMDVMMAHHGSDGLGLRCVNIDPDSASRLGRLVEVNLGWAGALEREVSALG
ncbi:MAG: FHA domain-containing protein [Gammaproteobacteria bacterium]|jgi:predicted component of type VI protein secretion system